LISWWPGDNTAIDIQSGNNGTLQNGATFASGEVGQAFSFDGSSSVSVADTANLMPPILYSGCLDISNYSWPRIHSYSGERRIRR
jgi:hypothetical protein